MCVRKDNDLDTVCDEENCARRQLVRRPRTNVLSFAWLHWDLHFGQQSTVDFHRTRNWSTDRTKNTRATGKRWQCICRAFKVKTKCWVPDLFPGLEGLPPPHLMFQLHGQDKLYISICASTRPRFDVIGAKRFVKWDRAKCSVKCASHWRVLVRQQQTSRFVHRFFRLTAQWRATVFIWSRRTASSTPSTIHKYTNPTPCRPLRLHSTKWTHPTLTNLLSGE